MLSIEVPVSWPAHVEDGRAILDGEPWTQRSEPPETWQRPKSSSGAEMETGQFGFVAR